MVEAAHPEGDGDAADEFAAGLRLDDGFRELLDARQLVGRGLVGEGEAEGLAAFVAGGEVADLALQSLVLAMITCSPSGWSGGWS
jgi:hypothetical protein